MKIVIFTAIAVLGVVISACGPGSGSDGSGGDSSENQDGGRVSDGSSSDSSASGPWGNGCDWCNGPGCETYDAPCKLVEGNSLSVVCPPNVSLTPQDHCFMTTGEIHHPDSLILCCCEPGKCPGV